MRDPVAGVSALQWSITAMSDTTERLPRVRAANQPRAFAVIGEAVWWVTIVDATLVRHHPDEYDAVMAGQPAGRSAAGSRERWRDCASSGTGWAMKSITLTSSAPDPSRSGTGDDRITAWTWTSLPAPALDSLPPRGQAWEMTRYRAYQAHLAGHTVGEVFARATAFLKLAAATGAAPVPDLSTQGGR